MAKRNALKVLKENVAEQEQKVVNAAEKWYGGHVDAVVLETALDELAKARELLARAEGA